MAVESVYGLMSAYQSKHPDSHYFDHATLKFFGERISEMYLFKKRVIVTDNLGEKHECYVLSSLQRKNPMGARRRYTYFDVETLDNVIL